MKNKLNINKNKILISLVALFTMLMCVSVGFATWIATGGAFGNIYGNIDTDDYGEASSGNAYCISDLTINPLKCAKGYGFVNESNGSYSNTVALTGTFTFNVLEAKDAINSLVGSKQFSLLIELNASVTTNFTFDGLTFTGFTNGLVSKTATSTATAYANYNITLTNDEYAQTTLERGFSITLTYGGTLSNFPTLESATYSVAITPSEVVL